MEIEKTECEGLKKIYCFNSKDSRGEFTKIFNDLEYKNSNIILNIKETYYSVSSKNVIRGMHFQLPPYHHAKIVHVIRGRVKDVLLDLRKNSKTYGQCFDFILDEHASMALYIPVGIAHGFVSLEEDTLMMYLVTSEYRKEYDSGVLYNSIGFDWGITNPIVSQRDLSFVSFDNFVSPF